MTGQRTLENLSAKILSLALEEKEYTADLLQRLVRTPSRSCGEGEAIDLVRVEMEKCGPDEVYLDSIGNAVARFGSGRTTILYDSHLDTVGVGDASGWTVEPYGGLRKDGIIYGRGASDNKAGIASMVAGLKILTGLGEAGDFTLYVVGIVQEEDCEGLALSVLLDEKAIEPDCVVLGECTDLGISRGHRGRTEIEVVTKGRSCHASTPERGDNAIYKMNPIIEGIRWMGDRLAGDPFLGKGSIAVTGVECVTASRNVIPDLCRIHIDRRVVPSDTRESVAREIDEIVRFSKGEVRIATYCSPSYKGLVKERERFFPAWVVDEDSRPVQGAARTCEFLFGNRPDIGKWDFSTDGNYSMGVRKIPTVGFGPGKEEHVHTTDDQVKVDALWRAAAFYALFPFVYSA